ncbi:MAG: hypothetical protein CMG74_08660 [Candidatus Marinimicrobia bacterium]|nr:hypothetical protein [Candidatus Neomarinimicrobiota bacterium]
MGDGIIIPFLRQSRQVFFLLFFISSLFSNNKFFISGVAISEENQRIRKAEIILIDKNGKKIKGTKTNKKGEFRLKKLKSGSYTLKAVDKNLGTGIASIIIKDKNLEVKITIPSKPASKISTKSKKKKYNQNSGSKYFKYWGPYRRLLSLNDNPQTFYGSTYYEATYNKDKRVKTVTEYDNKNNPLQTWNLKWTRSGNRSEYHVEFHTRGTISRLDSRLYSHQLSEIRPGWKAFFKSRKDGRPKEVKVVDNIGVHYYTYKFSYRSQIDSNLVMEIIESSYFRSDSVFEGRHLVFMEDGEWLRMIQYYNQKNKSIYTIEYIHDMNLEETVEIRIDSTGREIDRKIIPFMQPDQFAYRLEWTGRKVVIHEIEDPYIEPEGISPALKKPIEQYTSFEFLSPIYRDKILDEYAPRPFGTFAVGKKNIMQFGSTGLGMEIQWINHFSKENQKNLQTIGFFSVARSDISSILFFLPDYYKLNYKYGVGKFPLGFGLTMGFTFSPLINLVDLNLVPIKTKFGLVGNTVLAKGVLENIEYTYWATIGLNITFITEE